MQRRSTLVKRGPPQTHTGCRNHIVAPDNETNFTSGFLTEPPLIHHAPTRSKPGEYRGVGFTHSSSQLDARPTARRIRLGRIRLEIPNFLRKLFPWSNTRCNPDYYIDPNLSQPNHRHAIPMKSALRPSDAVSFPPRKVTFDESIMKRSCKPKSGQAIKLNLEQRGEKQLRVTAYDAMWLNMQRTFLRQGRFVKRIRENMSRRRLQGLTVETAEIWNDLYRKQQEISSAGQPEQSVALLMMLLMTVLLKCIVFSDLDSEWNPRRRERRVDVTARRLSRELLDDFFVVFEKEPYGSDHAEFGRDLFHLCQSAYWLRSMLNPTEDYKFDFFNPMVTKNVKQKGRERPVSLLKGNLLICHTIGSDRPDRGYDFVQMTLCGGLKRKTHHKKGPGGLLPRHSYHCERDAICAAYRPGWGEMIGSKLSGGHKWEQLKVTEARQRGIQKEKEVQSFSW